jgi:selenide,water dikinase
MEYILTFKNTNYAIKAEQCLLEAKLRVSALSLPPQIRAGCGICLRVNSNIIKQAIETLAGENIDSAEVFLKTSENGKSVYAKVRSESIFMEQKLNSLLDNCSGGGCGAKIGPGELSKLLAGLPGLYNENLTVGYDSGDDAGVYKIGEKLSVIMTADFFPPMVNDPMTFGRIAAANALSDVYAMGGKPLAALNLVCFPQALDLGILRDILTGGAEKVMEASAVLAGGHSIYDKEPKYGLAVTGVVENDKIIKNNTPLVGHKLILTKPLGTGIIMAALRGGVADPIAVEKAASSMERLNRYAAEKMRDFNISACTDITGFGLLAHALEMASDRVSVVFYPGEIPYIEEAYRYAGEFLVTAAGQRNRDHLADRADVSGLPFALQELMFDPQTSGGLLISVSPEQSDDLLAAIQAGDPAAKVIGEIAEREKDIISFTQ